MIEARFRIDDLTMDMKGHAGAKEPGEQWDLVCCAASTISQALIYNIEEWNEEHRDPLEIDLQVDKGMIHLHVIAPEWGRPSIMRMMKYGMRGMEMLQDKYCKYIRVTEDIRHGKE